jgi:hypothetical protein
VQDLTPDVDRYVREAGGKVMTPDVDRYVREAGGKVIGADAFGRLWRCEPLPDEHEPLVLLEVENATREPDGSARRYFLRVPPTIAMPHDGVAWSFGLAAPDYAPTAES